MLFVTKEEVDDVWRRIAGGIVRGDIKHSHSAKIAGSAHYDDEKQTYSIYICIYTDDFMNDCQRNKCRDEIRKVCLRSHLLLYKPDIFTILGIYKRTMNKFDISPILYRYPLNKRQTKTIFMIRKRLLFNDSLFNYINMFLNPLLESQTDVQLTSNIMY